MKSLKILLAILSISVPVLAQAKKPIIVAVIDTGITDDLRNASFLCKTGHKDFTNTGLTDRHGHGTHVSGIIDQNVKGIKLNSFHDIPKLLLESANYCQVILKYFDPKSFSNGYNEVRAINYAVDIHVDVINISAGGNDYSKDEDVAIKRALQAGIKIVVAAGNEKSDISLRGKHFYPASLSPKLIIVGNLDSNNGIAPSSNYGSDVNSWEYGTNVISLAGAKRVATMTGTSQACAVKSGKIVREMLSSK